MAVLENLVAVLRADTRPFEQGMHRSQATMKGLQTQTLRLQQTVIGLTASYLGARQIGRFFSDAARESMAFGHEMARVNTMLDEGTRQYLPQYEKQIKLLAGTYGQTAASLQKASYDILSATVGPAKAMGVLKAGTIAATAGFAPVDTVMSAGLKTMKAYNLEAEKLPDIYEDMAKAVKRGMITYEELSGSMGTVLGMAGYLDVEFKALMATVAGMTKAGLDADATFTAIKNIFKQFLNPSAEARQAAEDLGFALDATSIRGDGLIRIFDKLRDANAQQLEALMPNIRGLVGFAGQLKNVTGLLEDYNYMQQDTTLVQDNLKIALEDTATEARILAEHWANVKRELGEPIAPGAISGLQAMADAAERLSEASGDLGYWKTLKGEIDKTAEARYKFQMAQQGREAYNVPFAGPGLVTKTDRGLYEDIRRQVESEFLAQKDAQERIIPEMRKMVAEFEGLYNNLAPEWANQINKAFATADKALLAETLQSYRDYKAYLAESGRQAAEAKRQAFAATLAPGETLSGGGQMQGPTPMPAGTPIDWDKAYKAVMEQAKTETKDTTIDVSAAYSRMAGEMDRTARQSWDLRSRLLHQEYQEYRSVMEDKALLDAWYNEQQEKLAIERARATGTFSDGLTAGVRQMNRELATSGQLGYDLTYTVRDGLVDGFADVAMRIRDANEAMRALLSSIASAGLRYAGGKMFTSLLGAVGGAVSAGGSAVGGIGPANMPAGGIPTVRTDIFHRGGTVGAGGMPSRRVPVDVFAHAPSFAGGGTVPILAHAGETVHTPGADSRMERLLDKILFTLQRQGTRPIEIRDHRPGFDESVTQMQRTGQMWKLQGARP